MAGGREGDRFVCCTASALGAGQCSSTLALCGVVPERAYGGMEGATSKPLPVEGRITSVTARSC